MPNEADHIALANKNHKALMCLVGSSGDHSEWVVTIGFYKAVQVVSAALAIAGTPCHDHKSRDSCLKSRHPDIWRHYRVLWAASTIARYLHDNDGDKSYHEFSDYCSADAVFDRFIRKRLRPVEQLVVSHLSPSAASVLERIASN